MEWRRFVTYLWNDPRISCDRINSLKSYIDSFDELFKLKAHTSHKSSGETHCKWVQCLANTNRPLLTT